MGMFDSFYFETGVLPNNTEPSETEFQTKSLSCSLDVYRVDKHGNVKCFEFAYGADPYVSDKPINDAAYVYSIGPSGQQEYKILIHNSKIIHIEKTHPKEEDND